MAPDKCHALWPVMRGTEMGSGLFPLSAHLAFRGSPEREPGPSAGTICSTRPQSMADGPINESRWLTRPLRTRRTRLSSVHAAAPSRSLSRWVRVRGYYFDPDQRVSSVARGMLPLPGSYKYLCCLSIGQHRDHHRAWCQPVPPPRSLWRLRPVRIRARRGDDR